MSYQTVEKPAPSAQVAQASVLWLPLLVFAALLVVSAGLRLSQSWAEASLGPEFEVTSVRFAPLVLLPVLGGAVISAAWFTWLGRAGVECGRWVPGVMVWGLGAVLVPLVLSSGLVTTLPAGPVVLPLRQDASLIVIGAGLLVLAAMQRSRRLTIVALVFAAVAVVCTYASPENQLYDVLGLAGVRDEDMPWVLGEAFAALLPGMVLVVGFIDAWRRSLRSFATDASTLPAVTAPAE